MHTVIETPAYLASAADAGMTADEMKAAVDLIAVRPASGDIMPGTGGCRKVRVAGRGKGKSGGYRVISYYTTADVPVFLRTERVDMTKRAFDKIAAGLNDAVTIAEGRAEPGTFRVHIPKTVDVKGLRKRLGLTQDEFAMRYGFTLGRLRDWEQGRTAPAASDRVLLTVLDREPEAVRRALGPA